MDARLKYSHVQVFVHVRVHIFLNDLTLRCRKGLRSRYTQRPPRHNIEAHRPERAVRSRPRAYQTSSLCSRNSREIILQDLIILRNRRADNVRAIIPSLLHNAHKIGQVFGPLLVVWQSWHLSMACRSRAGILTGIGIQIHKTWGSCYRL